MTVRSESPRQTNLLSVWRKSSLSFFSLVFWFAAALVPARGESTKPLSPDQAFILSVARLGQGDIQLLWKIAPRVYLYREQFKATANNGAAVPFTLPKGETKDDPYFGPSEIFHNQVEMLIDAAHATPLESVQVTYQGCAELGICYPPIEKRIDLKKLSVSDVEVAELSNVTAPSVISASSDRAGRQSKDAPLFDGAILPVLATFFGLGLLLAFTPCIFPMVPILSGILVRSGYTSLGRSLSISLIYVLAMATAYATLGVAAAWSGQNLQIVLQAPISLAAIGVVFATLALSMFGFFKLPSLAITSRFAGTPKKTGTVAAAAVLGFGATLVVSPCITPPLAAALLYVAQSGDLSRGAAALFALGFGMGAPLLAFGLLGPGFLPRSGAWLTRINHLFGFVFLAMALWTISRILPVWLVWCAATVLLTGLGLYGLVALNMLPHCGVKKRQRIVVGLALTVWLAGTIALPGLVIRVFMPGSSLDAGHYDQTVVNTSEQFDDVLLAARSSQRLILVVFSAEWCVECKIIDRNVFNTREVQRRLQGIKVVHADMTRPTKDNSALMKRFDVIGPPTIFFLDAKTGQEIPGSRSIGAVNAETFIARVPEASPS